MGVNIFTDTSFQIPVRGYTTSSTTMLSISQIVTYINSKSCNAFYTRRESGYSGVEIMAFSIDSDTIYLCDKEFLEIDENWQSIIAADRAINDYQNCKKVIYASGWSANSIWSDPTTAKDKNDRTYHYTYGDQNPSSASMDQYIGFYLPSTVTNIQINAAPTPPPVPQGDALCKINYYLPYDDYEYAKITYKGDEEPQDVNDGLSITIVKTESSINVNNLLEGQLYWFKIFTNKSESNGFPYVVGPMITDWANGEVPSPMLCAILNKPYKYENQEEIHDISNYDIKALGYDIEDNSKNLYNNLIPTGSTVSSFWVFGNNQRGIYVYYVNEDGHSYIHMKAYYKNTILFDERLELRLSAIYHRDGFMFFGKNDITCKGSIIFVSNTSTWSTETKFSDIRPFVIDDTNAYYFITGRPNPADYTWYINNINGTGFKWKDWQRVSGSGYLKFPFSDYTQWRSDNGDMGSGDFDLESNGDARVFQTEKTRIDINTPDYVTYTAVLNPVGAFESEYYDGMSTYGYYTVGRGYYYRGNYLIQGMTNTINGYPYTATGTLEEVFDAIRVRCKNVSIYVNGVCWSEV